MKEIKIWKMALIWFGTTFLVSLGEILYSLSSFGMALSNIQFNFITFLSILVITLISGKVNSNLVKERFYNFKKVSNTKEILKVVCTQIFLSFGLANVSIGILAIANQNKALELLNDSWGNPTNIIDLILWIITLVILAPILEEIVFRRVLFKRLNMRFSFIFSSIVSSLIFGLGHETLGMLGAIAFGIACCVLYKKYNNLVVSISVHSLNNLFAGIFIAISYFAGTLNIKITNITNLEIVFYLISGGLVTLIGLVIFIKFIIKNKKYLVSN